MDRTLWLMGCNVSDEDGKRGVTAERMPNREGTQRRWVSVTHTLDVFIPQLLTHFGNNICAHPRAQRLAGEERWLLCSAGGATVPVGACGNYIPPPVSE